MVVIFESQNGKRVNCLHARIIVKQSWYDPIEIFFVSHFDMFSYKSHLTGIFLFNFETIQQKNHFDTILIKIHLAVIEILSFSCFVLFLVMADGSHLGMPNCEKSKWLHARDVLYKMV